MMIAVAVKHLIAAGVTGEALYAAIAEMEASLQPVRSAAAERQARYRERRAVKPETWDAVRKQVFERDGYECQYCGCDVTDSPQCDHFVPLALGGSNDISNLKTACKICNSSKSGMSYDVWTSKCRA